MKNKLSRAIVCCLTAFLLLIGSFPVTAAASTGEAKSFLNDILSSQAGGTSTAAVQKWINGSMTNNAGSMEWYAIGLSQYGNYDFSAYEAALSKYLSEHIVNSASSRQKYALALIATGSTDSYIYSTLNDSIGRKGVMSWIFGLHLLNNGYSSEEYTLSAVKKKLLSLQLSDGGWRVTGSYSDVDVTAMALQALAPHYHKDASVKSAVDKALSLLSERQKEDGDYASYGVNNSESTAQVLIALSALGIDCEKDSRFIKNGNTLWDGIGKYQLSGGTFCHQAGGGHSEMATIQVLHAAVAYLRMQNGKGNLYLLDQRNPSGLQIPQTPSEETSRVEETSTVSKPTAEKQPETSADFREPEKENTSQEASAVTSSAESKEESSSAESRLEESRVENSDAMPEESEEVVSSDAGDLVADKETSISGEKKAGYSYKVWVSLGILLIAGGTCGLLWLLKKRNRKNFAVIFAVAAMAILFVLCTDFQTTKDHYASAASEKEDAIGTVTITIRCDTVADSGASHIPTDGVMLPQTELAVCEGDTVYDILSEAAAGEQIHLETSGIGKSIYVEGINNLYEFDFGDLSGWVYYVNGERPSVSCGEYLLADQDSIEWMYTCALGDDLQ